MAQLHVIKTGSAIAAVAQLGDFEHWIEREMGQPARICHAAAGAGLPPLSAVSGAIVTGSAAMVTDKLPWSERCGRWLARACAEGLPILAICYGHQLLAASTGGVVADNPRGREIGTHRLTRLDCAANDPLLGALPPHFWAQTSHVQAVISPPPSAQVLAQSVLDPHHCFRLNNAWGVQFHPEFDATVMRGYLQDRAAAIAAEGLNPSALLAAVRPSPEAASVLTRFAAMVREHRPQRKRARA